MNLVAFHDKELITTTAHVAKIFGRRHWDILRIVEKIRAQSNRLNEQERSSPLLPQTELSDEHPSKYGVMFDAETQKLENLEELERTGAFEFNAEQPVRVREHGSRAGQLMTDPLYPLTKEELVLEERKKEVAARVAEAKKNMIDSSKRQYFSRVEVPVTIGQGGVRMSHEYEMNRDGFLHLVMGFTGEKACQFRDMFIQEFNRLEHIAYDKLRKHSEELLAIHEGDAYLHYSNELDLHREAISNLKRENRDLLDRLQVSEDKLSIVTKNGRYAKAHRAISKEAISVTSGKFYRHGKAALMAVERMKKMKDIDALKYQGLYVEDLLNRAMDANVDLSLSWEIDHEALHDEVEITRMESSLMEDFDFNFQKHNF